VVRAGFRVNAKNALEGFCPVPELPADMLVRGAARQNRAVHGDVVALQLAPPTEWSPETGGRGAPARGARADTSTPTQPPKAEQARGQNQQHISGHKAALRDPRRRGSDDVAGAAHSIDEGRFGEPSPSPRRDFENRDADCSDLLGCRSDR